MKIRIIDSQLVPAIRRPVDDVWTAFANHLITAFGDITQQNGFSSDDVDLVYCHHRLREIDEQILDSLVYNVPPAFLDAANLFGGKGEHSATNFLDERLQWKSAKDSPFLLLGYVGTGKTMFLDFYFYNHLPVTNSNILDAIVDFKTAPDNDVDFVMYMLTKLDECLADMHPASAGISRAILEGLYKNEVSAIRKSIESETIQTLEIDRLFALVLRSQAEKDVRTYGTFIGKKIEVIRKTGKQVWLVLDNIDQHFHCLHHRAFVNTVSIAHNWGCPLIIAMRYVTLHTPGARQTYDSFRPRRLKLSLPHIGEMLQKRIEFFKLLADPLLKRPLAWTKGALSVADLGTELQICANLMATPNFISKVLLPLSNYNLRRLLEILLSAFQSYFFFFDRFNNDRYIPNERTLFKRFVWAHLLKNNEYFDPSSRTDQDLFIVNVFENENPASLYNQIIRIWLLQVIMHFGRHVSLAKYIEYLQSMFSLEQHDVLTALRAFLEKDLIAVRNVLSPTFDDALLL